MRYLLGLLCVCALAGTLPLSARAQDGEKERLDGGSQGNSGA
jgi:hypothetical protein